MALPDSAKDLIRSGALGHLVTLEESGRPQVSCVWVAVDGDDLLTAHLNPRQRKLQNVRRDPRVSASYTRDSFAFIVHGMAQPDALVPQREEFAALAKELYVGRYGPHWLQWHERRLRDVGPGWNGRIEPRVMFAKR